MIGIATAVEQARWGVWDLPAHLLPRDYAAAVQRAGGLAVLLPPDEASVADPAQVLGLLDGLLLAGGVDVDPATYGQERHASTDAPCVERDRFELALVRAAVAMDLPVLAICRGMQVLNVALGGTLFQHLPESHGHEEHRRELGSFANAGHHVELLSGTVAADAAGETHHRTLSHHHQGVDVIGDGLSVSGVSAYDPVPEAVELGSCSFVLGVQWHPEADPDSTVIARLVQAAERRLAPS